MIHERIKELHKQALEKAVQDERERVHKILGREFQAVLGTGQPHVGKLLLKIDREVCGNENSSRL